jgi:hypothetical protein
LIFYWLNLAMVLAVAVWFYPGFMIMFGFFFDRGFEHLRQPDRAPRCYELTDAERAERVLRLGGLSGGNHPIKTTADTTLTTGPVR